MRKLLSNILLTLILMGIYIAYTGKITSITLITGFAISLTISTLLAKSDAANILGPKMFYLFKYIYHFIITEIKEHLEMARIILGRRTIKPGLVEIPVKAESNTALALLALTITNTPGTIAVHVNTEKKTMIIHWIDVKSEDIGEAAKMILGEFEHLAKKIFG
ncbi:MAG: Na+/H+ antiporter subunit E [Desulfurococcaceae archaeon]